MKGSARCRLEATGLSQPGPGWGGRKEEGWTERRAPVPREKAPAPGTGQ